MIFLACLMTVVIEGGFFAALGFRDRYSLKVIVCANIVTNLLLNLTILLAFDGAAGLWILPLEIIVIVAEYGIYAVAFGRGRRLLLLTLAANCLSYGLGLLAFRMIA